MPIIQVRGERDQLLTQQPAVTSRFNDIVRSQVKDVMRLGRGRAAPPEVVRAEVADDDVVEVELEDGLKLWVRGTDLEDELGAVRKRSATGDVFEIPEALPRRGAQRGVGAWLLKSLSVLDVDLPRSTAQELARRLEERLVPNPGVCRWSADGTLKPLGETESIDGDGKLLMFLHGTGSKTLGSFGALLEPGRQREWRALREEYKDRIFALEHKTLSESPIASAIEVLKRLPADATLHLVSHSRGGLVGELLCRAFIQGRDEPFVGEELELLKSAGTQRRELAHLGDLLKKKKPKIARFVRVACPARGTILASERLDHYLTVILNLLGLFPLTPPIDEIYDFFKAFVLAVVKERTKPESIPGLEAMMPESPFQKILNRRQTVVEADLSVIKGDLQGQGIFTLSRIKELATDFFYLEDHDLVVNTSAMDGGAPRAAGARTFFDQGAQVDHFSYFRNQRSAAQVIKGLLRQDGDEGGFEQITARSVHPALRALAPTRGGRRPIVFLVPTFAGTLLEVRGQPVWIRSDLLALGGLGQLAVNQPGVVPQALIDICYGDLVKALGDSHEVVPFPYDWRLSFWDEASRFAEVIEQRLSETAEPVRIVAHGTGGLLLRAALIQKPPLWEQLKERQGGRTVLVGVPHGGTYMAPLMLMGRDQMTQMLAALDFKLDRRDHQNVFRDFPSLLEMLPRDSAFDLFTPAGWSSLESNDTLSVPWSAPDAEKLKAAAAVREKMDGAPFDSDRMLYVAGQDVTIDDVAIGTINAHGEAADGPGGKRDVVFARTQDGDGYAPWSTAILPGMRAWYSTVAHGDLVRDAKTIGAIVELVQSGSTTRLPATPPGRRDRAILKPVRRQRMELFPDDQELAAAAMGGRVTRPAKPRAEPIRITVVHENLAFARHPLLVGHYRGDTLAGAEAHVDRMLDMRLSQRRKFGLYPDTIGTMELILDANDRSRGAVVVGLGDAGRLTEGDLRRTLTRALLRYAAVWGEERKANRMSAGERLAVSTLLIGSGEGGLPTAVCVGALIEALRAAQRILAEQDSGPGDHPGFREVEIVELYEHRAIQIWHAIDKVVRDGRADFIHCERKIRAGAGGRRRATSEDDPTWYQPINITMDTTGQADPRMTFIVPTGMARAEATVLPTHKDFVDRFIAAAIARAPDDPARGSPGRTLFELLLPDGLKELSRDDRPLRLILDEACAAYPWELMDDRRPWDDEGAPIQARDRKPPALRAPMIRQLVRHSFRQRAVRAGKHRALVIGDPRGDPTGHFNPLPAAAEEARAVSTLLRQKGFDVTDLIGERVTADEVVMQLCAQDWRIIHFATHGILAGQQGSTSTGIVLGQKMTLTADMLKQLLPFSPDLVFVNCCYLGAIQPSPARSNGPVFAANIAVGLIEMGVTAVAAAGWAVDDLAAQRFAEAVYGELLDGVGFGQAVLKARQSTFDAYQSSTTWGAYQCYGEPDWRLMLSVRPSTGGPSRNASPAEIISAADQIYQDAQTLMARDPAKELAALQELYEAAEQQGWTSRADLLTTFATAYGELGELEKACDLYERALASATGTTALRSVEQLANLKVRAAIRRPRRPGLDYEGVVTSALELLVGLIALAGGTTERFSLQGACYKRLAQVTTGARRTEALTSMAECYRKADHEARRRGTTDPYPIFMQVVARIAMERRFPTLVDLPAAIQTMVEEAETIAEQQDREDPSFWSAVPVADGRLLKLLAGDARKADQSKILGDLYLKNWNRGGSWLKFQSVLEQLDFFIDVWDDGDPATENARKALRRELVTLRDALAAQTRQP